MDGEEKTFRINTFGKILLGGFAIVAALVMILTIIEQRPDSVGSCGDWDKQGIDVSHYQGSIDWERVANETNIKFVYIKATEGSSHKDTTYTRNTRQARAVGLAVGSYHYFHPNVPVATQYNNFMSLVDLSTQDLIPVVDIEEKGRKPSKQICDSLDKFSSMVLAQWGTRPIIYTHQRFYNYLLQRSFDDHILWIARYGAYKFKLTPALEDERQCTIWQYSNRGIVEGIEGHVDLNTLYNGAEITDIMIKRRFTQSGTMAK
ncbi:MAG: glycosyl hydrolase family 25 [Bacteroidaceae bacterium]|nr:glycosyl hydrolase family 25 [Bacteroidaceae bacterium]MBR6757990.1 glycosyl hydrolase family 25 [Bacteroidaceae bacterium]